MENSQLEELLVVLLGPRDIAGVIPALLKIQSWTAIWADQKPQESGPAQFFENIQSTIISLRALDNPSLNKFPLPKKAGENPYHGRLLTKAPLWALTPISVLNEEIKRHIDLITSAFLAWTVTVGGDHVNASTYREWLRNPLHENPVGAIKTSLAQAGLSIRRLTLSSDIETLSRISSACWSSEKEAFHELLSSYSPEHDIHDHLMRLRSLHWLAHKHRRLYVRNTSDSGRERIRGITHSSRMKPIHTFTLDTEEGIASLITPAFTSEDVLGEDRSSISAVGLSIDYIKKSLLESGLDSHEINFKALYARARAMAKHLARSNQLHPLDARRLHTGELGQIDKILADDAIPLETRATLFFPLLTGRRWKSLSKFPVQLELSNANEVILRTLTNRPKITPHPECLGTDADVLLPIPHRWQALARALLARLPSTEVLRHHDAESKLAKLLKTYSQSPSPSKISKELAYSLFDVIRDEAIPALICDHLTPISTTKNHYVVVEKNRASQWVKEAWEKREALLPLPQGVPSLPLQSGHIGTHGHPDRELMQDWLHEAPFEKESTPSKQLLTRQYLMKEAFFLAHRGVSDPGYLLRSAPNRDLGSTIVLLNDKNRGGQHQMVRLALLPPAAASSLKVFETKSEEQLQGRHWYYTPHARTPYGDIGKTIRPQQLTDDEPAAPSPANGSRKMFRSVAVGKVPGELADAVMGWHSHGTVPFSEFSSLSPFMLQASMKGFTQGLSSFFESSRLENPHESDT